MLRRSQSANAVGQSDNRAAWSKLIDSALCHFVNPSSRGLMIKIVGDKIISKELPYVSLMSSMNIADNNLNDLTNFHIFKPQELLLEYTSLHAQL